MDRDDDSLPGGQSGYGVSLWPRVATAESILTTCVSKAWASGISAHPGERASSFLLFVHHGLKSKHYIWRMLGTPPGENYVSRGH